MGREESAHKPVEPTEAGDTAEEAAREESSRVSNLESELAETRDYLQSIQEQHEAANEELQAANEEVQSVNEEMGNCNPELNRLNSDLTNIQTSVHLAIVLLGRDLTIRRFSAEAAKNSTAGHRPGAPLQPSAAQPGFRGTSPSDCFRIRCTKAGNEQAV